jgi:hypothetical protein
VTSHRTRFNLGVAGTASVGTSITTDVHEDVFVLQLPALEMFRPLISLVE